MQGTQPVSVAGDGVGGLWAIWTAGDTGGGAAVSGTAEAGCLWVHAGPRSRPLGRLQANRYFPDLNDKVSGTKEVSVVG